MASSPKLEEVRELARKLAEAVTCMGTIFLTQNNNQISINLR